MLRQCFFAYCKLAVGVSRANSSDPNAEPRMLAAQLMRLAQDLALLGDSGGAGGDAAEPSEFPQLAMFGKHNAQQLFGGFGAGLSLLSGARYSSNPWSSLGPHAA